MDDRGRKHGRNLYFLVWRRSRALLLWLVIFVILDFLTGTWAAISTGTWSSKRNMLGVLKKVLVFGIVALAHGLDVAFQELLPFKIIESITICAYLAGEFGSIIENFDKMGLRIVPPVVRKLIEALNARLDRTVEKVSEEERSEQLGHLRSRNRI